MSSLAQLVVVLIVLDCALVLGAVGYLIHRHPSLTGPVGVMVAAAGVLAAIVVPIAVR